MYATPSHVTPGQVSALPRRNWRPGMLPVARPKRQENKGAVCSSPESGAHSRQVKLYANHLGKMRAIPPPFDKLLIRQVE